MPFDFNDLAKMGAGSAAGGGLAGIFSHFFGGNPGKDAMNYLDQIPDQMKKYLDPYTKAGQGSMAELQKQYGDLLKDPGSILSRLGKGYQESPGFQFQKQQGLGGIENAAAAGGMLGTGQHQQQAGQLANNLANQDYQQYLQNALGLYGQGLSGHQGLNQMGFDASNNMAQSLAQMLMSKGNLAYANGANQNRSLSDLFKRHT